MYEINCNFYYGIPGIAVFIIDIYQMQRWEIYCFIASVCLSLLLRSNLLNYCAIMNSTLSFDASIFMIYGGIWMLKLPDGPEPSRSFILSSTL